MGGISDDGRFVAFNSNNPNLVVGDTDTSFDVFVRDRQAATTVRVPGARSVSLAPTLSADGRQVGIAVDSGATNDLAIYNRTTGTTEIVTVNSARCRRGNGDGSIYPPEMSADGSFVVFLSDSTNLVSGDTNTHGDVFLRDVRHPIAPTVTIAEPTSGASSKSVTPCWRPIPAGRSGYGLTSCIGTVPNGAAIDTSTAGVKAFSVAATEAAGLSTTRTISYTVFDKIVAQTFGDGGGVVTTDPGGGPTPAEPVETTVASPNPGLVSLALGVATTPTPSVSHCSPSR